MSENRVTAQQKKFIVERAQGYCEYCLSQASFTMQSFSTDRYIGYGYI